MCFSLEADLAAGLAVSAMGVDALRHAGPGSRPLAALPLVLGTHLLIEAAVWSSLEGGLSAPTGEAAISAYLIVAFIVIPVLVPLALALYEPDAARRRLYAPFVVLGVAVAALLWRALASGPVTATIEGSHISYTAELEHGGLVVAGYVVATCVPALLSSFRPIVLFGVLNLVAAAALAWLEATALISLWCAWAALTSAAIVWLVRTSPSDGDLSLGAGPTGGTSQAMPTNS